MHILTAKTSVYTLCKYVVQLTDHYWSSKDTVLIGNMIEMFQINNVQLLKWFPTQEITVKDWSITLL